MTETPTERRLHRLTATSRHGHDDIAAIDKGRQAISILRRAMVEHDEGREDETGALEVEARALLTACQED